MADNTSKRRQDIVFLNILFCLLVIFIHVSSEVVVNMPQNILTFKVVFVAQKLSSFVVQGFLMLSGVKLFLNKSGKINYGKYYFGRFTRIIIPYIIWVFIYYCYFCSKDFFEFSVRDFIGYLLRGDLSAHFYFIIILVQFDILTPLWRLLYRKGSPAVHLMFALIVTVISSQYLMPILTTLFPSAPAIDFTNCFLRYQIYWTAGCLIGKNYEQFRSYLKNNILPICIGFILCAALNGALAIATVRHIPVWMEFVHIMYCISALLFFYMISQLFAGNSILKPLSLVDRASYSVYLLHCLVLVIVNDYMTDYGILSLNVRFGIRAAAVYGISITVCVLWELIKIPFRKMRRRS